MNNSLIQTFKYKKDSLSLFHLGRNKFYEVWLTVNVCLKTFYPPTHYILYKCSYFTY
jgi:hypothetical protein